MTRGSVVKSLIWILSAAAWAGLTPPLANAGVIYTYVGSPFTSAGGYPDTPPWNIGDRITGSVTLNAPLPANLTWDWGSLAPYLIDYSFSDGTFTYNPSNSYWVSAPSVGTGVDPLVETTS